jgi:hypothetical protein
MSDKSSLDGTPFRLKQDQVLFLILFIVVGVLLLVFVFTSFKPSGTNNPEKEVSLAQALTLVAEASQTAQAANPGFSASQAAHSSPVATKVATGTASPLPSSVNSTQTTSTRSPQVVSSPTRSYATATAQNNSQEATPTFPVSNATVRPTYTPKPTETLWPTAPPTPTLTPTATPGPGLPGLSMSAVIGQLENEKGFACAQGGSAPGPILWECNVQIGYGLWYYVELYGSPEIEVTNLRVSVLQTTPDEAKTVDILSFVASLPYDGSDASAASQWVAQTLPGIQSVDDVREKFIGGVRFRLFGGPQGRYMEMGEPPVQQ